MGFFSDLKEDLSQAVNELMPSDNTDAAASGLPENNDKTDLTGRDFGRMATRPDEKESLETTAGAVTEVENAEDKLPQIGTEGETGGQETAGGMSLADILLDPIADESEEEVEIIAVGLETSEEDWEESEETEESETSGETVEDDKDSWTLEEKSEMQENPADLVETEDILVETEEPEENIAADNQKEEKTEEYKGVNADMETYTNKEAVDETSVITGGMMITGDITSEGSVDIIGTINGNIDVLGKLNITGHINGNSKAAEVFADGAQINGEIVSEGAVKVGASTVIIGNITATSAVIAGAVKGDIDVKGPVILDTSAIVMGNIKSKSVQINNGAVIEGMCSQCYADVSPTSFFDEYKPDTVTKKSKSKQN